MEFVPSGIAIQFREPPCAPVRGCGAVFATAMPMPETAVDENGRFVFWYDNIRTNKTASRKSRDERRGPDSAARRPYLKRNADVEAEAVA